MNRLGTSTSTYLLEHADQPVHWWPYGVAAFEAAAARDVPVFISIGYSACHWCHVMSEESFTDPETAAYLNANFVCIKVDRLEHPQVDAAYIAVVQAMTGRAGWPLSAFTDSAGLAFYAGMYYPKVARGGQPSLRQVCEAVLDAWRERREQALTSGRHVVTMLQQNFTVAGTGAVEVAAAEVAHMLTHDVDTEYGGSGAGAKFPELCLKQAQAHAVRRAGTHPELEAALRGRYQAITRGGLTDHLEGGIFRYTVDREWRTPHFEKMLLDNSLWLETLVLLRRLQLGAVGALASVDAVVAHQVRGLNEALALPVTDSRGAGLVETDVVGGDVLGADVLGAVRVFATSRSADSDPAADVAACAGGDEREGAYYRWNDALITAALGDKYANALTATLAAFDVTEDLAALRLVEPSPADVPFAAVRETLRAAQRTRPAPHLDELLTLEAQAATWAALADHAMVYEDTQTQINLGHEFLAAMSTYQHPDATFAHAIHRNQRSTTPANLADLGALGWAAWRIHQASQSSAALDLLDAVATSLHSAAATTDELQEFAWDPALGPLPAATPLTPNVIESAGPSSIAWGLRALRGHVLSGSARGGAAGAASAIHYQRSEKIIAATLAAHARVLGRAMDAAPSLAIEWFSADERTRTGSITVHLTPGANSDELARVAYLSANPNLSIVRDSSEYPAGPNALAYVCHEVAGTGWCEAPTSEPSELTQRLT